MAEPKTLKRKATVAVHVTPGTGGMEEGPFVCHLPSRADGMPPSGTEFSAWRKNIEFRGQHLVLRGRTRGVDYVGTNFDNHGTAAANACSWFVARLKRVSDGGRGAGADRGGGGGETEEEDKNAEYQLDVVPIGGGQVIQLETRCHALEYASPAWEEGEDMNDPATRALYNDRLLKAFSSAKRQRKVSRIQAERKVDASSLAAPDAMRDALIQQTKGELDGKALADLAGQRRNIPAHDQHATNPHDAYPLRRFPLYPLLERSAYKELLDASKKPSAMDTLRAGGDLDVFVLDLVPELQRQSHFSAAVDASNETAMKKEAAKALAALDQLLAFRQHKGIVVERRPRRKDDNGNELDTSDEPLSVSWTHETKVDSVTQRAYIDTFMTLASLDGQPFLPGEPKRWVRPKAETDLITLHVILMALRAGGWQCDVTALCKKLKMSLKDITPLCKELGLVMGKTPGAKKDGGGATTATLKLDGTKPLKDFLPQIKKRLQAAKKRE